MRKTLWLIAGLIFIIIFNAVFFVAGGAEHPSYVWISYAFIHFSYIMVVITPLLAQKSNSTTILNLTLSSISAAYFLLEFVIGIVFMFVNCKSYKPALLTQIIVLGIYGIILLLNIIANEDTAESESIRKNEVLFVRESAAKIKLLIGKSNNKETDKNIERLYDIIHSSPAKSDYSVKNIETDITNGIFDLESAIRVCDCEKATNICKKIICLAQERNSILKSL